MALLGLDTPVRKAVFTSYLALWCLLRVCIYASQRGDAPGAPPPYNAATLLVVTTLLKIAMSVAMFLRSTSGSVRVMWQQLVESRGVFLRYFFPAAAYVIYDNLMFFCLRQMDPVTYVILMQFRLPTTAAIWQAVFGKSFSAIQWCGLGFITLACVVQRYQFTSNAQQHGGGGSGSAGGGPATADGTLLLGLLGVVVQIACGVFSSVYNEFMLKSGAVSIDVQNVFLYSHSLVCNVVYIVASGGGDDLQILNPLRYLPGGGAGVGGEEGAGTNTAPPISIWFLPISLLLATIGIVTALFLKHLDSVRKSVASAIELFGDAFLAYTLFGIAFTPQTAVACAMCSLGIYLYSQLHRNAPEAMHPQSPCHGPRLAERAPDSPRLLPR